MRISEDIKVDFKDVLIVPQRSTLKSRQEVKLCRTFKFPHSPFILNCIPIIAANMDTVGTLSMAKSLGSYDCLVALHKYYAKEDLVDFFTSNVDLWKNVFYTVGVNDTDINKLREVKEEVVKKINYIQKDSFLFESCMKECLSKTAIAYAKSIFPMLLCLDAPNGYTKTFVDKLKDLRQEFPNSIIMAGNIVTPNMTEELINSGADIVKCGIGGGACCLTRKITGVGYPQLSAIDECSNAAHGLQGHVCGDGGCTVSGDICKAFAAGGDFVMLGGMLGGTDECEGEWEYEYLDTNVNPPTVLSEENKMKKSLKIYGMSSVEANDKYNGGLKSYRAAEGKCSLIPYKGKVENVIKEILGGIRSCCTYVGAECLKDLPKRSSFVRTNVQENKVFDNFDVKRN